MLLLWVIDEGSFKFGIIWQHLWPQFAFELFPWKPTWIIFAIFQTWHGKWPQVQWNPLPRLTFFKHCLGGNLNWSVCVLIPKLIFHSVNCPKPIWLACCYMGQRFIMCAKETKVIKGPEHKLITFLEFHTKIPSGPNNAPNVLYSNLVRRCVTFKEEKQILYWVDK